MLTDAIIATVNLMKQQSTI